MKEGKGYVKENNNYFITYEGEYLNGFRHGKGKEYYYNNILVFEGEYKYGKRWDGKWYYEKKISELKNGKGFIKDYIYKYDIIFEGEYLYGEKMEKEKNIMMKDNYFMMENI